MKVKVSIELRIYNTISYENIIPAVCKKLLLEFLLIMIFEKCLVEFSILSNE